MNELTTEEVELIVKIRAEQNLMKEEMRKSQSLEDQFKNELNLALSEIQQHLNNAREEIQKATKISDITGIPFSSNVICLDIQREYTPKTFNKKWGKVEYDFMENLLSEFGMHHYQSGGQEWQYWNTSSLDC